MSGRGAWTGWPAGTTGSRPRSRGSGVAVRTGTRTRSRRRRRRRRRRRLLRRTGGRVWENVLDRPNAGAGVVILLFIVTDGVAK